MTLDSAHVSDTLIAVSGLTYGHLYFWRVQGGSGAGTGPWSAVWRVSAPGARTGGSAGGTARLFLQLLASDDDTQGADGGAAVL